MPAFPLASTVFGPAIRQIAGLAYLNINDLVFVQVTTTDPHKYRTGLVVRFSIPPEFGAVELDQLFASMLVTSPTQFVVNFLNDSGAFNPSPFVVPAAPIQVPLVIPIAEDVDILYQAEQNLLPNG